MDMANAEVLIQKADGSTVTFSFTSHTNAAAALDRFLLAGFDAWSDYDLGEMEGPTCSICDALGHGYPGGGPCPLEQADYSGEPEWAM